MPTPNRHILSRDDLLIFLHIPKTAGTSLNHLLTQQFKPEAIVPFHTGAITVPDSAVLIRQTPKAELKQYRYMATHLDYSIHEAFPQRPVFVTLLRDPIERVLSNYWHLKRHRTPLYETVPEMSLQEFLTSPITRDQYYNRQTCQLAGVMLDPDTLPPPDDWLLSRARQHLDKMAFVGIQEHFAASVYLLNYTFGWTDTFVPKMNVAPQARAGWYELPSKDIDTILEANQLDLALYDYANQLFGKRLEAMLADQAHQSEKLSMIENSWAWKSILGLHAARTKLIPADSRRERIYHRLRAVVARD